MPRVLVNLLSLTGTKGGMEIYTRELYSRIAEFAPHYEFHGFASSEAMKLDLSWFPGEVHPSGISGEHRISWALGELFAVSRHANRLGVDLVHSPATLGPWKTRMPSVVTMHDMLYWSHPQYMSTGWYTTPVKWMERLVARNAARIITDSDFSASEIRKYLDVPAELIDSVPLAGREIRGVDRTTPRVGPPLVLATGARRPHKNWDSLVRALPLIEESVRPRLVVTGSHGEDPLRAIVEELGLQDWVELKSWVSTTELAELYSTATIMAMPTFCEGFGLPVIEAMAAGIPVLISDIPVYREVAGDAALYLDPYRIESIAAGMVIASTQPDTLADLVERGRAQASLFSWEKTARETVASFEDAFSAATSR